jgi:hypothetical protein
MKCPHLSKDVIYVCMSNYRPQAPGCRQLKDYCKTGVHVRCPKYMIYDGYKSSG